jgi:hypothetical protein
MVVIRIEPLDDSDPQLGYTRPRRCDRCGRPRVLVARVLERRQAGPRPASVLLLERDLCGDCADAASRQEGEFAD